MSYKGSFKTLGLHNDHTTRGRPVLDYYSTPPEAVDWLLKYEHFDKNIWEPMCGGGHISEKLKEYGFNVTSSDIKDYGYKDTIVKDFKECDEKFNGDIVSNPPYRESIPMVLKALELTNRKVAYLMKIQFLETIERHKKIFKEHPPARIYVFTKRIKCLMNGKPDDGGSAVCYCWVVWDKGCIYEPVIRWIPNYEPLNKESTNNNKGEAVLTYGQK